MNLMQNSLLPCLTSKVLNFDFGKNKSIYLNSHNFELIVGFWLDARLSAILIKNSDVVS